MVSTRFFAPEDAQPPSPPTLAPARKVCFSKPFAGRTRTPPGPIRDPFFMNFLLHHLPNPRSDHHFRALRALSEMRASPSRPCVPFGATVLRNEPNPPSASVPLAHAALSIISAVQSSRPGLRNEPTIPSAILCSPHLRPSACIRGSNKHYETNPTSPFPLPPSPAPRYNPPRHVHPTVGFREGTCFGKHRPHDAGRNQGAMQ